MTARLTTLLIWAAVLVGAVAWGLPLFTRSTPVPPGASLAVPAPPAGADLARLLGQAPVQQEEVEPAVVADSRFRLLGVVAPRPGQGRGLALISVDGKPARAVGVGRELEPGLRLLTVGHRQAELGPAAGTTQVTLTLPPLAEAQRGRPGDLPGMAVPGQPMAPGAVFNGVPGAVRMLPPPQQPMPGLPPVPVPQGVPTAQAGLPYQPDDGPNSSDTEAAKLR